MPDDFDRWNEIKKGIESDSHQAERFPQVGEVWMVALGRNIGYEQNGGDNFSRPVLVVKKFNNQMFWITPLSTKQKAFDFYFNFTDPSCKKVSAILAQLKLMSIKRFDRKLYDVGGRELRQVKDRLRDFLV